MLTDLARLSHGHQDAFIHVLWVGGDKTDALQFVDPVRLAEKF